METFLIAWCVWTGVILFLCPLIKHDPEPSRLQIRQPAPAGLDYIRISVALLNEWEMLHSDLLLIDLRQGMDREANGGGIPGSLHIPAAQLAHLLRWVPPASRLVFYNEGEVDRFSATVEQALLSAGIDGVFILDGGIGSWAYKSHGGASVRVESPSTRF
jgi:rhodanese-related sulfurtransferase